MANEQSDLLEKIRALSGAIDQRRQGGSAAVRGSAGPSSYPYRGAGRRGRGSFSPHNQYHGATALPSRHRTLVLSGAQNGVVPASTNGNGADPIDETKHVSAATTQSQDGWVKRKSTHNMSLVSSSTFEKTEPARLAALAATQSAKDALKANKSAGTSGERRQAKSRKDGSIRRGDNMGEVIIDGVTFEFDETGTKLVKKTTSEPVTTRVDVANSADEARQDDAHVAEGESATPLRTNVNGQQFVRTKTGNMISQALLDQRRENKRNSEKLKRMEQMGKEIAERQKTRDAGRRMAAKAAASARASKSAARKSTTLCAYFTKTAQCKNGLRCPFKHDPARLAICPRFLRPNGCPLPEGTCPLSHRPTSERVPHCVHYLANAGHCRNGDSCTYTHPTTNVTNESPICMPFSDFGWCEKGRSCEQRHTWDCPEFLRKGKCDRRGCKLMHVVRNATEARVKAGTSQLDDDELFVRDDEAFVHPEDASDDGQQGKQKKRKRDDLTTEAGGEVEDDAEDDAGISFKVQKSKEFSGQDDFISFDDFGEDEESMHDDDDDDEEAQPVVTEETASVHSESEDEGEGDSEAS